MKKQTKRKAHTKIQSHHHVLRFRLREGLSIASLALAVFLFIALISYPSANTRLVKPLVQHQTAINTTGLIGSSLAKFGYYLFGDVAYLFPILLVYVTWLLYRLRHQALVPPNYILVSLRAVGSLLILVSACAIFSIQDWNLESLTTQYHQGGILGYAIARTLLPAFNFSGAAILIIAMLLTGITLVTGLSWLALTDQIGKFTLHFIRLVYQWCKIATPKIFSLIVMILSKCKNIYASYRTSKANKAVYNEKIEPQLMLEPVAAMPIPKIEPIVPAESNAVEYKPYIEPQVQRIKQSKRMIKDLQVPLFDTMQSTLPPLSLLDVKTSSRSRGYSHAILESMSREVETHLRDFGVDVQVVAVHPGPVITRFELQLAPGVKVSRISSLDKDLARSLSVISVRIVEVIPGKSVVGLEVPNSDREIVLLSEVLASQQYDQARSPVTLALGKDISGHPVIVDLAKMPHLLVAGTTGAGKSVALNVMLMSLLYKSTQADVRLILIDPKMLELSIYEGIPHLLAPVVTDMKEAANALRWCVAEMERRYKLMASMGVRNLLGYNTKLQEATAKGEVLVDPSWPADSEVEAPVLQTLPFIVVVIDEFADMMMVVGKKVEQLIARIAQKARAAGIHMILATQRPSVDVITGLIKANIPTRIAFQVSSKIDSRTILDQQGAEQLLGHGDMLYLPPGTGVPVRVHGAFVDDHEVHKVVKDLKTRGLPDYIEDILSGPTEAIPGLDNFSDEEVEDADPLYQEAVEIVRSTRKASISGIQRRLKIGYNRAARLVEEMEKAGLVSAMESNGNREVLLPTHE